MALIAASMVSEDLIHYRNFTTECQRIEKQILAQSKGLLEVLDSHWYQEVPRWLWSIHQDNSSARPGPATVSTPSSRIAIALSREVLSRDALASDPSHLEFLIFGLKAVSFVHRSAYDFMCSSACEEALGKLSPASRKEIQHSLLTAKSKLLVAAPSHQGKVMGSSKKIRRRLGDVFNSISIYSEQACKDTEYLLLDELRESYQNIQMRELTEVPLDTVGNLERSWNLYSPLEQQLLTQVGFWDACISWGHFTYLQHHLTDISELEYGGVALATLCDTCVELLPEILEIDIPAAREARTLLVNMLRKLEHLYKEPTEVRSDRCLRFGEVSLCVGGTVADYDISWVAEKKALPSHNDEVFCQMAQTFQQWAHGARDFESTKSTAITNHGPVLAVQNQVEDISKLLKTICAPWDLYIGTSSNRPMHWSEHSILIQVSINAFVDNTYALNCGHREDRLPATIYESPPKFRIICASRNPPKAFENETPLSDCITAIHDLGPRATTRLGEFFQIRTRRRSSIFSRK